MRKWERSSGGLRRRLVAYGLLAPGAIWLIIFFVVPMYFMAEMSLRSGIPNTPEGFTFSWEFANYSDALAGRGEQVVRTFYYSGAATVIALLIAYPLAYAIALKVSPRWRLPLLFAVIAPFFTTYLIRTIAWETILYDDSPIVDVLKVLAIVPDDGRVLDTGGAVIAGLTYNFLPFMILPIYASIERIDTRLIEAGRDLYASARQAFLRVTLPLTMPGVVAGVLLTFIPASGDYVNAEFLGGANNAMLGNKIQSTYLEEGDYPEAAALSFLMMAAVLIVVLIYLRVAGTEAFMAPRTRSARRWSRRPQRRERRAGGAIRAWSWLRRHALNIYLAVALAYMLVPIAVIAVFSFVEASANRDRLTFAIKTASRSSTGRTRSPSRTSTRRWSPPSGSRQRRRWRRPRSGR